MLRRMHIDGSSSSDASCSSSPEDAMDSLYQGGQSVMVLRSDGISYSRGTVLAGFEGVFETLYQVRLESGQIKQAVPENEMYDATTSDDPNFGRALTDAMAAMMESETLDERIACSSLSANDLYIEAFWCCSD